MHMYTSPKTALVKPAWTAEPWTDRQPGFADDHQKRTGDEDIAWVQMGGPEGVRARERYTLVTGIVDGMWMHAIPRPGSQI